MTQKILGDPKHPITVMLLYIFSIESFINPIINSAFKKRKYRKVFTLGPFSTSIFSILQNASENRVDIDKLSKKFQNITLFRGCGLTYDQIIEYQRLVDKRHEKDGPAGSWIYEGDQMKMALFGFVSASFSRSFAENNAFSDKNEKKISTLIVIEWAGEQEDSEEEELPKYTSEPELI